MADDDSRMWEMYADLRVAITTIEQLTLRIAQLERIAMEKQDVSVNVKTGDVNVEQKA